MTKLISSLMLTRAVQTLIIAGGLVAVAHDGTHYAVPVAFFWCFLFLWNTLWKAGQALLTQYIAAIESTLHTAHDDVTQANQFLATVQEASQSLQHTQEAMIRLAHQEAAHILQAGDKEQEMYVRNYRESLAIGIQVMHRQACEKVVADMLDNIKQSIAHTAVDQWPLMQSRLTHRPKF